MAPQDYLLELKHVSQVYAAGERHFTAIQDFNLTLAEGEFCALLGPSGCGKSTLLRIITGLQFPTRGEVLYRQKPVTQVNPFSTIVFQTFALFPWLTVQENVELALEARGLPPRLRTARTLEILDRVGLDGFENAYPRELSGGMRQKVGFARAIAVEPELLCLDEPFSNLDVLSAETLRGELLELWTSGKLPTKAVLMVTHNIEEAVLLADRAIVLSHNPGRVIGDFPIKLSYPRDRKSSEFTALVDRIYRLITRVQPRRGFVETEHPAPLPRASMEAVAGLAEVMMARGGREDLYRLASDLGMEADELLSVTQAAEMLGLGRIDQADFILEPLGREFAEADVLRRKELLRARVLAVPLVRDIRHLLDVAEDDVLPEEAILARLRRDYSDEEARAQIETAIDWGRYAELFAYDDHSGMLSLENPVAQEPRVGGRIGVLYAINSSPFMTAIAKRDKGVFGSSLRRPNNIFASMQARSISTEFARAMQEAGVIRRDIDPAVIKLVPAETAQKYQIIPLSRAGATLTIAGGGTLA